MKIDLNADIGEGFGRWTIADDAALMNVISSANIACGFHAGDHLIMDRVVRAAKERGVAIGAHPGLPDRMGFGRRTMVVSAEEMEAMLAYQIGALRGIAARHGLRVGHVSYHAAFGTMANADQDLADRLARVIAQIDPSLVMLAMEGQPIDLAARKAGLRVRSLFLADRAYQANGALVPRGLEGAVIHDLDKVKERVKTFLETGKVITIEGKNLAIRSRSILVHSDTPGSDKLAQAIASQIDAMGGEVSACAEG
ncbi:LamB/YcsF family protein [Acetobacter senegalensis]|uniref:LamB/YcsF family protein n=1 Tax=Acetobacter senegalensis TaxID=446692 RepID=UPI0026526EE0|nr:5-oxoprolinase subunit PxpA [Acetobacter senegalensis]MDN7349828.1 5-oxoprolinase subunit PxpA [Acetobacter senegalensis]